MAKFLPFQDATQMLLPHETLDTDQRSLWPWKRWFAREEPLTPRPEEQGAAPRSNLARRISRRAIPGLPRPGTFKRQKSELRHNLEAVKDKQNERRAFSVDPHRAGQLCDSPKASTLSLPRNSAPTLIGVAVDEADFTAGEQQAIPELAEPEIPRDDFSEHPAPPSIAGSDDLLDEELEKRWILNLSMHFRDRSNREKFFVTYAETPTHWRRVTISLDYREAPPNSLEEELQQTQYQRDKSARIYEAIRESLPDIQFYDTVTNLKLQTESERLHVHVTEDMHEVIQFPPVSAINHLYCQRVKEQDLVFDSHLSGFVYKVTVNGRVYIKKEIPGPDTVEEFLYEVNALHRLAGSDSVIQFGGVITSNDGSQLKGLLISFAEKGALIDVIYDGKGELSWPRRERWAKQIVQGLSEIHEAGFVQGDFTLSNIVIDGEDNAKIIDINRRGCPVGWEPPEVAALIESKQRISMYIGVKSDIFQLGMVLWALAMQQDEPEIQPRPLTLASAPQEIPSYYRALVGICLSDDPRTRCHTTSLLSMFPEMESDDHGRVYGNQPLDHAEAQYIDPANAVERDDIDNFRLMDSQTTERGGLAPSTGTHTYVNVPTDMSGEAYFFPRRGRSPPRSAAEEHELEPRIVTVSPGRHYLEEYPVSEIVPNNVVDDFVVPHDLAGNDASGGGEATVHFDIEDTVGDNEHTNPGENRHAINSTEDSPEDTNHINNAAEDVATPPAYEIEPTQNITTATANESASLINGDAIGTSAVAPRYESEGVLGSLGNATESNTAVSRDYENIQIPAATLANEDVGDKRRDATENHKATADNGGESTLNAETTAMSNDSGYAQSATEDNSTVVGFKSDDIVATESMSGDISYITGNVAEDRAIAPGDGIEEVPNVAIENTITDNTVLGGPSNIMGYNTTGNGPSLPTRLRTLLLSYIARFGPVDGVGYIGLERLLQLPKDDESGQEVNNEDFSRLDLASSIGSSVSLKHVMRLIHPPTNDSTSAAVSWDAPSPPQTIRASPLIGLTHVSLANPGPAASWVALLAFAAATPTLTHMSLASWPAPNLTPNATAVNAKMSARGSPVVNLAAEDRYAHSIDLDFSAAAAILRRLARRWYSLEYLDVDGCAEWWKALYWGTEDEGIDWAGDWARVRCISMRNAESSRSVRTGSPFGRSAAAKTFVREFEAYVRKHRGWIDIIKDEDDVV